MTASANAVDLALAAAQAAADKSGHEIRVLDVSDQLVITDCFVLASAPTERGVTAISDEVQDRLRDRGVKPVRREGEREGRWVLLDFVDVVVHVQHAEERAFYQLERLWKDCPEVPFTDAALAASPAARSGAARGRGGRGRGRRRRRLLSGTPPRRLVLLRHGRTSWNATGRFQGQLDVELDEVGRAQATAVAPVLAAEGPARVLSSDSARAAATAAPLAAATGLEVATDRRLREIDLGAWTGLSRDEAQERFPDEYDAWTGGLDLPRGGGETYRQVAERATAAIAERLPALPAGGLLVVVTHGGTARATIGRLLDLDPDSWWRLAPLGNTSWSTLVEARSGWRLAEHGARVRASGSGPSPTGPAGRPAGDDARTA